MRAYLGSCFPLTLGVVALMCGLILVGGSAHKPNSGQLLLPAVSLSSTLG